PSPVRPRGCARKPPTPGATVTSRVGIAESDALMEVLRRSRAPSMPPKRRVAQPVQVAAGAAADCYTASSMHLATLLRAIVLLLASAGAALAQAPTGIGLA